MRLVLPVLALRPVGVALALSLVGCGADAAAPAAPTPDPTHAAACTEAGGEAALASCLTPKQSAAYYVAQAEAYFDTLDTSADRASVPIYSELVARWEWPPWLKLTGYGKKVMTESAALVIARDPSTVPTRECEAFDVQPFARCYVSFQYEGGPCPIYEEFVFNDAGEMTFLEAWTASPTLLPTADASDRWAEGPNVHRLSTRIPGLGSPMGRIDPAGASMTAAAAADPEVADFATRAQDFFTTWVAELNANGKDIYARGCGW